MTLLDLKFESCQFCHNSKAYPDFLHTADRSVKNFFFQKFKTMSIHTLICTGWSKIRTPTRAKIESSYEKLTNAFSKTTYLEILFGEFCKILTSLSALFVDDMKTSIFPPYLALKSPWKRSRMETTDYTKIWKFTKWIHVSKSLNIGKKSIRRRFKN